MNTPAEIDSTDADRRDVVVVGGAQAGVAIGYSGLPGAPFRRRVRSLRSAGDVYVVDAFTPAAASGLTHRRAA